MKNNVVLQTYFVKKNSTFDISKYNILQVLQGHFAAKKKTKTISNILKHFTNTLPLKIYFLSIKLNSR